MLPIWGRAGDGATSCSFGGGHGDTSVALATVCTPRQAWVGGNMCPLDLCTRRGWASATGFTIGTKFPCHGTDGCGFCHTLKEWLLSNQ